MDINYKIQDDDVVFTIDAVTREIRGEIQPVIMQYDHNAEEITFTIPKTIEGMNMNECNKIEIHYINGDVSGIYEVTEKTEQEDKVLFTWLISSNATQHAGPLVFSIRFAYIEEAVIKYQWLSKSYTFNITKSLFNLSGSDNQKTYIDILESWKKEFENKGFNLLTLFDSNGETSYIIKIHEGRLRLYNKLEEGENNE